MRKSSDKDPKSLSQEAKRLLGLSKEIQTGCPSRPLPGDDVCHQWQHWHLHKALCISCLTLLWRAKKTRIFYYYIFKKHRKQSKALITHFQLKVKIHAMKHTEPECTQCCNVHIPGRVYEIMNEKLCLQQVSNQETSVCFGPSGCRSQPQKYPPVSTRHC